VPGRFVAFQFAGGRDAPPPGGAESEPVGMEAADGPHLDPAELEGMFRAWGVEAVVSLGGKRSAAPPPLSLTVSWVSAYAVSLPLLPSFLLLLPQVPSPPPPPSRWVVL
jgi:hypothetical protein